MTSPDMETPESRRKALLIAGASGLLLLALTAMGIPQWAYWEIQGSRAAAEAQAQDAGLSVDSVEERSPLSPQEQSDRVAKLKSGQAVAPNETPCDPNLTPYAMGTNWPLGPPSKWAGKPPCVATSRTMSLRPAPGDVAAGWGRKNDE